MGRAWGRATGQLRRAAGSSSLVSRNEREWGFSCKKLRASNRDGRATTDAKLAENCSDMNFDRAGGDIESTRDLLVGETLHDQLQNIALAAGQSNVRAVHLTFLPCVAFPSLVALPLVWDLLFRAKHLFVAAILAGPPASRPISR
jgi:hypothetical protein